MTRDYRQVNKANYNFSSSGAIGYFAPNSSQPLEFIMTSIKIDDIINLSFARDIQENKKDFDALIQRDIDEDRARKEICNYLAPENDEIKGVVFLPPLIVSIIEVDDDNKIQSYYPDMVIQKENDPFGGTITREWEGLFKVKNYIDAVNGAEFNIDGPEKIDLKNATLDVFRPSSGKGGRLVVIDGQHRLFALEHLRRFEKKRVSNVSIPVCIIYSPLSTLENKIENQDILDVPSVLRKLFVDINSTVEKVSGHYLTLLSDDNLGSIICREFCASILHDDKYEEIGLAVIEWNTKNHKESKTISRKHSITSIGVIYSVLEEYFSRNKNALSNLFKFLSIKDAPVFNSESDSNDHGVSSEFPWRDFQSIPKSWLKGKINESLVDGLKRIFFEPKAYQVSYELFKTLVQDKTREIKERRDIYSECSSHLENYFVKNIPIPKGVEIESKCKLHLSGLIEWFTLERELKTNRIYFLSVFQKAYITAYLELSQLFIDSGIVEKKRTDMYIYLADKCMDKERDMFNSSLFYMQSTIFDGARIKTNKSAVNQLKRLILSLLGDSNIIGEMKDMFAISTELCSELNKIGKEHGSAFFSQMKSDKEKSFAKGYKHSFNITADNKRKLNDAENARFSEILSTTDAETKLEANVRFEELVRSLVKDEILLSAKALIAKLGFDDFFYLNYEDESDEQE
ncbi:hypothetical protein HFD95_04120 [Pantoea sp. EKM10T]|uniref:hypothetical protein n=1 Tax=Pantoea sp. EKM10T TaxID=2708058 RepID=UPI00142DDB77|nr:hypothetical protein [Pantoea sp. EKM10T]KAF6638565.1 hypothetical protein HFD95_04120 [Pantoea sp. EKM10T]